MPLLAKGRVFIVAEVAQAHDGSLGNALAFIDAAAEAGVDAVKFQDHRGDPNNRFREGTRFPQDDNRTAYWSRTSFTSQQWAMLRSRAALAGVRFGVSPFSRVAVGETWRPDFWKIGSGQIANRKLIEAVLATRLPVIVSAGMATEGEIRAALAMVAGVEHALLQCTSEYPCPAECVGLNVLREWQQAGLAEFVGLSDHSGELWPSLAAAAHGASVLEVHVCWDKRQFGPDTSSSVTIDELRQLVRGVRFVERMLAHPINKDVMASRLKDTRTMFMGAAHA